MRCPGVHGIFCAGLLALSASSVTGAAQEEALPEQGAASPPLVHALAELEQGRVQEATAILEQADAGATGDPRIAALLGAIYVEIGRHAEALEVLAPLAEDENADVAVLYNAGRAAAALEQFDRAERYLQASVDAFPASPAARELGFLRLRRGRFMPAYLMLKPWSRTHANDTEAITAAAQCAVQLGRGAEAEQLLQLVPTQEPRTKLLWAQTLLLKDDPWSALAVAKEAAEAPPPELEVPALLLLADVYLALDQPALAVEALSGHTDGRPLAAVRMAEALRRQQQVAKGLELLEPFSRGLIEDDPEVGRWLPGLGAEVALEYGLLLAAAGSLDEAVRFLRAATDLASQSEEAWRGLADALERTGERSAAAEARQNAERIALISGAEPTENDGGTNLGSDPVARQLRRARALLALDETEAGLRIARQEKTLVPEDPRPPLVEAQMLMELGRPDEALAVMDAAEASFPANADVHYYRGVVQLSLNRPEVAEQSLKRAIELVPEHVPALTDLAALLLRLDRREEGKGLVERVLAIAPGDPTATHLLEQLESS